MNNDNNSNLLRLLMRSNTLNHLLTLYSLMMSEVIIYPWKGQKYGLVKGTRGGSESLNWFSIQTSRVVGGVPGGVPGYGFDPLPGPSREWWPCQFPRLQFPIMAKLRITLVNHPHRSSLAKRECWVSRIQNLKSSSSEFQMMHWDIIWSPSPRYHDNDTVPCTL